MTGADGLSQGEGGGPGGPGGPPRGPYLLGPLGSTRGGPFLGGPRGPLLWCIRGSRLRRGSPRSRRGGELDFSTRTFLLVEDLSDDSLLLGLEDLFLGIL